MFAMCLKADNPANTKFMKEKYMKKLQKFISRCEIPEELSALAEEKEQKNSKGKWANFKEVYYNQLGAKYDTILKEVKCEKEEGFATYIK